MTLLNESEWEIGGVRFGTIDTSDIFINSVDLGEWEIASSDVDNPAGNGVLPGSDKLRGATWSFNVQAYSAKNEVEAFDQLAPLLQVWANSTDLPAGKTMMLRFAAGGRQLAVYGRPRRYSQPVPDYRSKLGILKATVDFLVTDPNIYQVGVDGTSVGRLEHILFLMPNEEGGVFWDDANGGAEVPFWWDGSGQSRQLNTIVNRSTTAVPFEVIIHGPVQAPTVQGDGWKFALTGNGGLSLAWDRYVTINTRDRTVLFDNGTSAARYLSRDSRLATSLKPGTQIVTVSGSDPTGQASVDIKWSEATKTISRSI